MIESQTISLLSLISVVASFVMLYFVSKQLREMRRSYLQDKKNQNLLVCFEITKKYDEIYEEISKLIDLSMPWDLFDKKYKTREEKLGSYEWKLLRKVASCFEFIGVMIKKGYIEEDDIFEILYIRLDLWDSYEEIIKNMRKNYFDKLWINWEYLQLLSNTYFHC